MAEDIKQKNNEKDQQEEVQETKKVTSEKEDLKQIKAELEDITDRYKRVLAEFENSKKRNQKERENLYNSILSDIIEMILPILDNLENAAKVETKDEEYKKGIELVLKQFQDTLKSKGVEEIKALGETFDPELHEAVSSVQDHSMVVVAN